MEISPFTFKDVVLPVDDDAFVPISVDSEATVDIFFVTDAFEEVIGLMSVILEVVVLRIPEVDFDSVLSVDDDGSISVPFDVIVLSGSAIFSSPDGDFGLVGGEPSPRMYSKRKKEN